MEVHSRLAVYLDLIRWDRPAGWLLLLWPTLSALWIAADGWPGWHLVLVFTAGTVLMRSAGCCFNDVADQDFEPAIQVQVRQRGGVLVEGSFHGQALDELVRRLEVGESLQRRAVRADGHPRHRQRHREDGHPQQAQPQAPRLGRHPHARSLIP